MRGERGMGKTLMLQYIANPPADLRQEHFANCIFLFFNCPDTVIPPTEENFWFQAIKHLHHKSDSSRMKDKCQVLLEKKEQGTELSNHDFHDILDLAGEEKKRIVLVLDDFDVLIKTNSEHFHSTRTFLQGLRSLTTRNNNKANLVLSTRSSLHQLCQPLAVQGISPFDNGFTNYTLQPLREQEIQQLLQIVEETEQPPFSEEETNCVISLSGCHPHLARMTAGDIFQERIERGAPLEDLTPLGEKVKTKASPLFQDFWTFATEMEQLLLMLITLETLKGKVTDANYDLGDLKDILSKQERELRELTERGLLTRTENNPCSYSIFSPLFQWWILKEIESTTPEALKERRKAWGITRKQADIFGKGVEWVKDNWQWIAPIGNFLQSTV